MMAVLVVIGLMIGGVLVARDMIQAGEIKAFISDKDKYIAAANNFKAKYDGLPGDITNATKYWGVLAAMPGCGSMPSPGKPTCNGNGSGKISSLDGFEPQYRFESYRFWHHLANAGLVEGTFTGADEDGDSNNALTFTPGVNVPEAARKGLYYRIEHEHNGGGLYYFSGGSYTGYGNFLTLAREGCNHCGISALEAATIDRKIDDGSPAFGKVRNGKLTGANFCTTSADPETAAYDIDSDHQCVLHFLTEL